MKLYSKNNFYKLYQGNMLEMLDDIEENSIDSVVTDPPYELNFMNKGWDNAGVSFQSDTWKKCYDVLKPGGYLLAFGGSRTFHRIACAIEDAGFEIRDTIMWLYGSGFPKSMNIGLAIDKKNGVESIDTGISSPNARPNSTKDNTLFESGTVGKDFTIKKATNKWQGWGTCLKPSFEPIIVARKPFKGSLVDNVIKNGVGGLNIDECRVGTEKVGGGTMPDLSYVGKEQKKLGNGHKMSFGQVSNAPRIECEEHEGRFPANTILTYDETPSDERLRYFYCAKASKKDRDEGLEELESKPMYKADNDHGNLGAFYVKKAGGEIGDVQLRKNTHPTVKPTELMQYLIRLVTPTGGTILDPFNGSGSTGKAVMYENKERDKNYKYIGIEITEEYLPIARARIEYVCKDLKCENEESLDLSDLD